MAMKVEKAIMICVYSPDWFTPKYILAPTGDLYGRRIKEIAREVFEEYKATQQNKNIVLRDYYYQGDVEVLTKEAKQYLKNAIKD